MFSLFSLRRFSRFYWIAAILSALSSLLLLGLIFASETRANDSYESSNPVDAVFDTDSYEVDDIDIKPSRQPRAWILRSREPRPLRKMIANSGCFRKDEVDPEYELELEVSIAASWQGISKDRLAAIAKLEGDEPWLSMGKRRMLVKAERGITAFKHDLTKFGADICPLVRLEWAGAHEDTGKHYFKAAHVALGVAGCSPGDFSGTVTPAVLRAWNAAAEKTLGIKRITADEFPSPSDVITLIRNLREPVCDKESKGVPLDVRPLVRLASELHYGCNLPQTIDMEMVFRSLTRPNAGRALTARALAIVWNSVEAAVLFDENSRVREGCSLPESFTTALVDLLHLTEDKKSALFRLDIFANSSQAASLHFGRKLIFGVGTVPNIRKGEALLAKSGARDVLKSALAAGVIDHLPENITILENPTPKDTSLFEAYVSALEGRNSASEVARLYAQELGDFQYSSDRLEMELSYYQIISVIRLADLAAKFPSAAEVIGREGNASLNYAVATMLFEGHGDAGRNIPRGMTLLEFAANKGSHEAQFRLAVAKEHGFDGVRDHPKAIELYERAANGSWDVAAFSLARIYEEGVGVPRDLAQAKTWYTRATEGKSINSTALIQRTMAAGAFLRSSDGRAFLEDLAARTPGLAESLGKAYSCIDCGGVVDIAEAARWYRMATKDDPDGDAAYHLSRILMARPDLAANSREATKTLGPLARKTYFSDFPNELTIKVLNLVAGTTKEPNDEKSKVPFIRLQLARICLKAQAAGKMGENILPADPEQNIWPGDRGDCVPLLHALALGSFGVQHVSTGFDTLRKMADEKDRWHLPAAAFADILAFYGDFRGAALQLDRVIRSSDDLLDQLELERALTTFEASKAIVRRSVVNQVSKKAPSNPDLLMLLDKLSKAGDQSAASLLKIANSPPDVDFFNLGILNGTVTDLQSQYAEQTERGGISPGLVERARSLGAAFFAAGDRKLALRYELIGLQTERELHVVDSINRGPIAAALADVCALSHSSQRVAKYGYSDAAMVLAKLAVNRLQDVRRDIAGLPERLQLCFRDTVGDYYRWLADLFIQQKSAPEAEFVMSLLDDFERFQFVKQDKNYSGDSFLQMPFTPDEEPIRNAIASVTPPLTTQAKQYSDLVYKRGQEPLTPIEVGLLKTLSDIMAADRARLDHVLEEISDAAMTNKSALRRQFSGMQSRLAIDLEGNAAAIRYVILPDKIDAIMITPDLITSYTWDTINGEPFSETTLDRKIDVFRVALQDPNSDPRVLGKELYDILFKPLSAEIRAIGATKLFVSSDRRLRYVPFTALYDGTHYLIEDFVITEVSGVEVWSNDDQLRSPQIAFLGVSDAVAGFEPLPNVLLERDSIVRQGAKGILPGKSIMNTSFTRDALQSALIFMDDSRHQLGVVHIASHFSIGRTDSESFLVTGDGQVTVEELKGGEFRFTDVDLLTLSACDTASAIEHADGSGLKSLASIAQEQGARAVLASLWPIRDTSTATFMRRFYEIADIAGIDRATALAQVMREFIGDSEGSEGRHRDRRRGLRTSDDGGEERIFPGNSHPTYWAPFVFLEGF